MRDTVINYRTKTHKSVMQRVTLAFKAVSALDTFVDPVQTTEKWSRTLIALLGSGDRSEVRVLKGGDKIQR